MARKVHRLETKVLQVTFSLPSTLLNPSWKALVMALLQISVVIWPKSFNAMWSQDILND